MDIAPLSPTDDDAVYLVAKATAEGETPDIPFWSRTAFTGRLRTPWAGTISEHYVARVDGGCVAGLLQLHLPQQENTANVTVELSVDPACRRRGVGRALYEVAVERARALGRRNLQGQSVDAHPDGPAFAAAMGATVGLREVRSRQEVADFDTLGLDVPTADSYHLVRWGRTPDELVDDVAYLEGRLFGDSPTGDLGWEPEKVDAARIRAAEESHAARGRTCFNTGAVHAASGRLVAWTLITAPDEARWHAWQQITLVDPGHRGHRLGLAVKVDNLRHVRQARPELRAVDTFNAADNAAMIRVNERLGYRVREEWTYWTATV